MGRFDLPDKRKNYDDVQNDGQGGPSGSLPSCCEGSALLPYRAMDHQSGPLAVSIIFEPRDTRPLKLERLQHECLVLLMG